jgi:tetratricopeptide (TPR) repeat protein
MPPPDLDALNQRELRKLVLSIKASAQRLDLLLAICDDRNLQARLIADYEQELRAIGITPLQARLNPKQPSLRATLETLVAETPRLQAADPAVVTVLNAGELLGVRFSDDKSEQEQFFFSLQWTREALRQFQFPIVLWLPDAIATRLSQQAPDFWSWRSGVFEFVAQPGVGAVAQADRPLPVAAETTAQVSPEWMADLGQQIADLEATTPESPLLITLYNALGKGYRSQYAYPEALELYEKALKLAEVKADPAGQARSRFNIGDALRYCGRPFQAVEFYDQALTLYRELDDRQGEANSLGNLGNAYFSLGEYRRAIAFHEQYLDIAREIGDRQGEANSLGSLGNAYFSLGEYRRAIAFHEQYLDIAREIGDRQGEAAALGNLGNAYNSLGEYRRAIAFQEQNLDIAREIGDRQGEATALFNRAIALAKVDEPWAAQQSLEQAQVLYVELQLEHRIEQCDQMMRELGQIIVAQPHPAPTIGPEPSKPKDD